MSPRKSDIPLDRSRGWRDALIANAPLPLLVAAMVPLGWFLERSGYVETYYTRVITLVGYNVILAVSLQLINGFSGQFSLGHAGFMAVGAYLAAYPAMSYSHEFANPAAVLLFYGVLVIVVGVSGGLIFGLFAACRASKRWHPTLPALLMLLLIAWLMVDLAQSSHYDAPPSHLIWSRGISTVKGAMESMIEHGQPLAAKISRSLPEVTHKPLSIIIILIGAGCCAASAGLIVGLPALRLRGDYLAIATLGMGEIIRIIIINTPALGGALGLNPIPRAANFAWVYGTVIVTLFVIWRIAYAPVGRAIMAVREDEIASSSVGIHNTYYKVQAFVIGAFFAGVAGALFAIDQSSIGPSRFTMDRSIEIVVMVTLGGLGSITGAILAAAVLTLLPEVLRDPPSLGVVGWIIVLLACGASVFLRRKANKPWRRSCITIIGVCLAWEVIRHVSKQYRVDLEQFRMILYASSLILMMLLRPQGLLGGRELWPRRRAGGRLVG